MNRALLNPFVSADLPKGIEEVLDQERATCVSFNRHGNLLAVGTQDADVVLWDFDTRSVAATLRPPPDHPASVTAVSFPVPRNGSLVLVSYTPGTLRVFDALSAQLLSEVVFDAIIVHAIAHPKLPAVAIAIPRDSHPLVVHLRKGVYHAKSEVFARVRDPSVVMAAQAAADQRGCRHAGNKYRPPKRPYNAFGNKTFGTLPPPAAVIRFTVLCTADDFDDTAAGPNAASRKKRIPFCVAFTRAGDRILRGGATGVIRSFALEGGDVPEARCTSTVTVQGRAAVRSIIVNRKTQNVLVNSHDRCMRLFTLEQVLNLDHAGAEMASAAKAVTIDPITMFTEIVNKTQCRCACFSSDGDYVLGGMEGTEHKIHIWRAEDGHLELTLEGAREGVSQIRWHPLRGVIVSVGTVRGQVYVWAKNVTDNWSAFATEFSELEANEEYIEKEDEFDVNEPEDEETRLKARELAEAGDVEVCSCVGGQWFSSDSEEDDTFFYLPAVPSTDSGNEPQTLADKLINAKLQERSELTRATCTLLDSGAGQSRKRPAERRRGKAGKRARSGNFGRKGGVPVVELDGGSLSGSGSVEIVPVADESEVELVPLSTKDVDENDTTALRRDDVTAGNPSVATADGTPGTLRAIDKLEIPKGNVADAGNCTANQAGALVAAGNANGHTDKMAIVAKEGALEGGDGS